MLGVQELKGQILGAGDNVEDDRMVHADDGFMTVSDRAHCPKANVKLFLGEDRTEIVGVNSGIIISPLFRVDVLSSSQGVQFHTKVPRMETNDEIES